MKQTPVFQEIHTTMPPFHYRVHSGETLTLVYLINGNKIEASITMELAGEKAKGNIIGFVFGRDAGAITIHTRQIHTAPHTSSSLFIQSILSGSSTFQYDGNIRIERQACDSDAHIQNNNLLASGNVHVQSIPTLEILTDDVRCTHGVATGTFPTDVLWYLTSRGIGISRAKKLYTQGLLHSGLTHVSDDTIRHILHKRFLQKEVLYD